MVHPSLSKLAWDEVLPTCVDVNSSEMESEQVAKMQVEDDIRGQRSGREGSIRHNPDGIWLSWDDGRTIGALCVLLVAMRFVCRCLRNCIGAHDS